MEEESLYYALVKGHEFLYWNYNMCSGSTFISNRFPRYDRILIKMSKEDWNELGISDTSTDFVKVDDC